MPEARTLLGDFELKGEWWLPGQREEKWFAGILRHDAEKGITLELGGAFSDRSMGFSGEEVNWPVIHGATYEGKCCTLFDAHRTGQRHSSAGTMAEHYSVDPLVIGGHFSSLDEMKFDSFSVSYTEFEGWCRRRPFDDDPFRERILRWNKPKSIEIAVDVIDSDIQVLENLSTAQPSYAQRVWSSTARFKVIPRTRQTLGWCVKRSWEFENLLTLLMGCPCLRLWMKGVVERSVDDGRKPEPEVEVFPRLIGNSGALSSRPWLPLIPLPALGKQFPKLLNTWFARAQHLQAAHNIFFSLIYEPSKFQDTRFLVLTQALEAFYRRKYSNKLTQRDRYGKLLGSLDGSAVALVTDKPNVFIARIVDTRNDLTHRPVARKKNAFVGVQLHAAAEALDVLMMLLLLEDAGVETELVVRALSSHWQYQQRLERVRRALS